MPALVVLAHATAPETTAALAIELEYLRRAFDDLLVVGDAPSGTGVRVVPAPPPSTRLGSTPALMRHPATWRWVADARGLPRGIRRLATAASLRRMLGRRIAGDAVFYALGAETALPLALLRDAGDQRRFCARVSAAEVSALDMLQRRSLMAMDCLLVAGESERVAVENEVPRVRGRIRVTPAGVPAPRAETLGSEDGRLRLLTAGTVPGATRLRLVLSALRKLESDADWTHIGGGEGLPSLEASARSLPGAIRTRFVASPDGIEVDHFLDGNRVDLFVDIGEDPSGNLATRCALAHGVPVLSLAGRPDDELLAGWTLPADTPTAAITAYLERVARMSDRGPLRRDARLRWERSANAEQTLAALVAALQDLA